jgi:hypothetical protein
MNNNEVIPEIIYSQVCKTAETFWEWRHKVLTRFMVAIAGLMAACGWFYKEPTLKKFVFVPLLLGVIFSLVSFLLDRVNTSVLRAAYHRASEIEKTMTTEGGIFTSIHNIHSTRWTHYNILRFLYIATAVILLIVAIVTLFLK